MGHTLTLEMPDEAYTPLAETAKHRGSTPEELAVEWLVTAIQKAMSDPVEQFIGAFNETSDVDIYAKCEFLNPGGSIKDRMAPKMIEAAEKSGKLKPGGTIVDQSTRNTGPALSFVGAVKGYNVQLFLPSQLGSSYNPEDRIRIARLFACFYF